MRCFQASAAHTLSAPFRLRVYSEQNSERFAIFHATLGDNSSRQDAYPNSLLFFERKRKQISAEDQEYSGEANCTLKYPDYETFWQGMVAAGPTQNTLRTVSEEELSSAFQHALEPFRLADGGILIQPNVFIYVVATV